MMVKRKSTHSMALESAILLARGYLGAMIRYIQAGTVKKHYNSGAVSAIRGHVRLSEMLKPYHTEGPAIVAVDMAILKDGNLETPYGDGNDDLGYVKHQLVEWDPLVVEFEAHVWVLLCWMCLERDVFA